MYRPRVCARKHVRPLLCAAGVRDDLVKIPSVLKRCPLLSIPIVPDDRLLLRRDDGGWPAGRKILRDFPIYVFRVCTARVGELSIIWPDEKNKPHDYQDGKICVRDAIYLLKTRTGPAETSYNGARAKNPKKNVCISIGLERYELINGHWTNGERNAWTHCVTCLLRRTREWN